MKRYLIAYAACLIILLIADTGWLSWALKGLYKPHIGDLLLDQPLFGVAALFYLIYAAGVAVLAVQPALRDQSLATAALHGAFLGLVAYGAYDLTNMATLRGWSATVTVMDMVWGTVLTALAASGSYVATARWG